MFAVDDQHIAGHSGVHFAQQKLPSLQNECATLSDYLTGSLRNIFNRSIHIGYCSVVKDHVIKLTMNIQTVC